MRYLIISALALALGQTVTIKPTTTRLVHPRHYLAQCPTRWATTSATLRRGTVRLWAARRHLVARKLGKGRWAITGAKASRDALRAAGCTIIEYDKLGTTARAALRDHLTCCGEMTWRGRTYKSWPCAWADARAIHVITDGGTGPGVTAGRAACPAPGETAVP